MKYTSRKELAGEVLCKGDEVVFSVGSERVEYRVSDTHLCEKKYDNEKIFRLLGMCREITGDKYSFAAKEYGYPSVGGNWPTCDFGDFVALSRLVRALFLRCEREDERKKKGGVGVVVEMKIEDVKVGNRKEAIGQYEAERKSAEIDFAKRLYAKTVDDIDALDRQIRQLTEQKKPLLETLGKF